MSDTVKIKFLADYKVNAANGDKFKKGSVKSMSAASAAHHVSRGHAEYVVGKNK